MIPIDLTPAERRSVIASRALLAVPRQHRRTQCLACSGDGFLENGDGTTRGCSYCGGNEGIPGTTDRGRDGSGRA